MWEDRAEQRPVRRVCVACVLVADITLVLSIDEEISAVRCSTEPGAAIGFVV